MPDGMDPGTRRADNVLLRSAGAREETGVRGSDDHRCRRCRAVLRSGNTTKLCAPCERAIESREPSLAADFYARTEVATALAEYDFGAFLKAARAELGLTQEDLGHLVGLAQSRICKVETGVQRLRDIETIARLATVPRTPPDLLGFPTGLVTLVGRHEDRAVSWLHRRDFVAVAAAMALGGGPAKPLEDWIGLLGDGTPEAPRRIGLADVERIEATTAAFRDWDNRWGGGLSREAVLGQLRWVIATSRSAVCHEGTVRSRLLSAVADLANVAAFMSYDVERQEDARRLWLVRLQAAREAGDAGLAGSTLRQLTHQALHLNRPDEALRFLRLAQATTADPDHRSPDLAMAETAAYQGWCYAAAGKAQNCGRALGEAEEHFANAGDDPVPPWLGHFNLAELTGLRGHAYHVLANAVPKAARLARLMLREAVHARPPEYARGRALNLIALSATYFQNGDDLHEGIAAGRQALDSADGLNSPRSLARLRGLLRTTQPYAALPDVAQFQAQLTLAVADGG